MLTEEQTGFLSIAASGAVAEQHVYKVPAVVSLAQACVETGWGHSVIGKYNVLGIKENGRGVGIVDVPTHEWVDGRLVEQVAKFERYSSIRACFLDHGYLITLKDGPYHVAWLEFLKAGDLLQFCIDVGKVYTSKHDGTYGALVWHVSQQANVKKAVESEIRRV